MEYNLRPQWTWWRQPVPRTQQLICGKCGLYHKGVCFSIFRTCFACHKPGHYARMCFNKIMMANRQKFNANEKDTKKQKSEKRFQRDKERYQTFVARQQEIRAMPFANIRNGALISVLYEEKVNLKKEEVKDLKKQLKEKDLQIHQLQNQIKSTTEREELYSDLKIKLYNSVKNNSQLEEQVIDLKKKLSEVKIVSSSNIDVTTVDMQNEAFGYENDYIKQEAFHKVETDAKSCIDELDRYERQKQCIENYLKAIKTKNAGNEQDDDTICKLENLVGQCEMQIQQLQQQQQTSVGNDDYNEQFCYGYEQQASNHRYSDPYRDSHEHYQEQSYGHYQGQNFHGQYQGQNYGQYQGQNYHGQYQGQYNYRGPFY